MHSSTQRTLESSYRTDLNSVRVHEDSHGQDLARSLSARAVTYGNHIFLGPGERQTDLRLMAHETAHVLQQQAAPVVHLWAPGEAGNSYENEAHHAADAVMRHESFNVQQRTAQPQAQRLGMSDALDYFADKANIIPGFRMFTIVIGMNPINGAAVDRSPGNIVRAIVEFLPGGGFVVQALENSGVFDKVGNWVAGQLKSLGMVGSSFKTAITDFLKSLSWKDIFNLGGVWERAKSIFTTPITQLISFVKGLINGIIQFIKDAILKPIAKLAEGTEGYNLLKGILGKDPITGEPVPRTAETLLGPLLRMIGLGDVWSKMQQANAIPRAWAWFLSTIGQLVGFVSQIPGLFVAAFKSLTIEDIILVPKAFAKIANVFGGFVGKFVSWGLDAMFKLLEIVFDVVSPGAFGYIKKTGAALKAILKNPLPFISNLVAAAKAGFNGFKGNFVTHLKTGLLDWLTGSLPGVYIPKSFSLIEFGKMALSILGISWAQIRAKIVKNLGPNGEMIMQGLETAFDVIKALITGGPAAAWEVIKEKLTNLKDMIVDGIIGMVKDAIVTKAIPKLIGMFIPGAGFISAIISIYDTVMVFVNKISKIIQVVTAFINSIVQIAAGNIGAAASKVESILAGMLSLAINFLAGFAGLGKVADKVMGIINKVRDKVDKALDTAIAWIIGKAKALFARLFSKKNDKKDVKPGDVVSQAGDLVVSRLQGGHKQEEIDSVVAQVRQELAAAGLKKLEFGAPDSKGNVPLWGEASPGKKVATVKTGGEPKKVSVVMVARLIFKAAALPAIEQAKAGETGRPQTPLQFGPRSIPTTKPTVPAVPDVPQVGGIPSGTQQATEVATPPRGQHKYGTAMLQPASAAANEVKTVSWNTGDPVEGSNSSHAEASFTEFLSWRVRRNLKEVHATINYSPCSMCSGTLPDLKADGITASLSYGQAYVGYDKRGILASHTTTTEDIGRLSGKQWNPKGPSPKWTNATKEKERVAGNRIIERNG